MTKKIVISTAAVPEEFERRLVMAARLLAASAFEVSLQPWDGSRHELLVADADDAYGRTAIGIAARRGDAVLRVSRDRAESGVAHDVQIAELTRALRRSLGEVAESGAERALHGANGQPTGVLAVWQKAWQTGADFALVSGAFTLIVRRRESRVLTHSHADLAAAHARFARETWTIATDARHLEGGDADRWQSIDAFLIEGCVAAEHELPPLEGTMQLAAWPDTGTLPDGEDVLRMASALTKRPCSVADLAARCRVSAARANAFCWAARAGGLLAERAQHAPVQHRRAAAQPAALSIVARLARRFGLSFGERA